MTDTDADVLPATVGLLLWRPAPGGRELCVLGLAQRSVLPKGVLRRGEDERAAAVRLAHDLCAARVDDTAPLAPPPGGGGAVAWWSLRWSAPLDGAPARRGTELAWLSFDDAQVELAHRFERELVRSARPRRLARLLEWLDRPRRRRLRRARWDLEDLRARQAARPDGPAQAGVPSWRARAASLLERAAEAGAQGDDRAAADALAEARRLELFGLTPEELAARRVELAHAAQDELEGGPREAAQALLAGALGAADLAAAAALVDRARAARARAEVAAREERLGLGSVLIVGLLSLWLFGDAAWYGAQPTTSPADLHLAVLLFGLMGGATSALLAPGRGPALLRPALGAAAALALHALLASGTIALGNLTPGAWSGVAFVAGFAERWVCRPAA